MSRAYFNETQRFRQWWIYMIFLLVIAAWIFSSIMIYPETKGEDSEMTIFILILQSIFIPLAIFILLRVFKLTSRIRNDGIHYRFFPLQLKEKFIGRDEIERFEVRKYKPVSEYGGWGVKTLGKKHGKAINISGNIGLQLYLKNGSKILIGTQEAEKIKKAMNRMMKVES